MRCSGKIGVFAVVMFVWLNVMCPQVRAQEFGREPDAKARKKLEEQVRKEMKVSFDARTPQEKRTLIQLLTSYNTDSRNHRYAALHLRSDLEAELGEYEAARRTTETIVSYFPGSEPADDLAILKIAAMSLAKLPGGEAKIASDALDLIDLAIDEGDFDTVHASIAIARAAACKTHSSTLAQLLEDRASLAHEADVEYHQMPLWEGLPCPKTPEQDIAYGRYTAFIRLRLTDATGFLQEISPEWKRAGAQYDPGFSSVIDYDADYFKGCQLWLHLASREKGRARAALLARAAVCYFVVDQGNARYADAMARGRRCWSHLWARITMTSGQKLERHIWTC